MHGTQWSKEERVWRWYAVTKNYAEPHVVAEFLEEVDAEAYDRTFSNHTEEEMWKEGRPGGRAAFHGPVER